MLLLSTRKTQGRVTPWFYIDMGGEPADNWCKLMTAKEIIAGMNQLNGRKILILDLVSSDIFKNYVIQ